MLGFLLLIAGTVACGGGGDDDEEDVATYFQELSAVAALGEVQIGNLERRFPDAFEDVEQTKQYQEEYVRIYDDFVQSAKGLAPPDDLAEEHEQYIVTSEELQRIARSRLGEVQEAGTQEQIDAIFAPTDEYAEAVAKQDFACSELKRIADSESIPVPGLQGCGNSS
jgi:hypothetical protein